jgi:DHA2 family multidrug resistance protein
VSETLENIRPVNPWLIALTVMLATFMEVLDTRIANVSLPHIAGTFSATVNESTWVLTSYLVSNAIVLPITGWLSRLFGRKRFYIACVVIFTVCSFLCGLAPSLAFLVVFRVIQGAGGGGLQPTSQAILVESFDRPRQGMAMAVYGMGVVVAPIIGPTLGGWITDNYSWRWIFFINIPIGILSILMTSAIVSDPPYLSRLRRDAKNRIPIDYMGLGFLCVGLGFLQIVLDKGQQEAWFSSNFIIWCSIIGVIGLVGTVIWELSVKDPVIDLHLFKDRNYAVSTFAMFMLGVILYGTTVLLPVLVQTLMGYTAELAGLVLSPGAVLTLFCMPLVGRLLAKYEARWLVIIGLVTLSAGMFRLASLNLTTDFWTFVTTWMISRSGLAFLFVPINVMAFYFVPKERINNATGLINLARNMGGSIGISLVTTIQFRLTQAHQAVLVGHLTPYDLSYRTALEHLISVLRGVGVSALQAETWARGMIYGNLLRQSSMLAYVDVFWMLGAVCLALIPLMFLMRKTAPGRKPAPMH